MTIPSAEGSLRYMEAALHDAVITPLQVDYINAHATSTFVGDAAEAQAIAKLFGNRPLCQLDKIHDGARASGGR